MNVSSIDDIDIDDFLFKIEDLKEDFGGDNDKNNFGIEIGQMNWVDPATVKKGNANETKATITVTPPTPPPQPQPQPPQPSTTTTTTTTTTPTNEEKKKKKKKKDKKIQKVKPKKKKIMELQPTTTTAAATTTSTIHEIRTSNKNTKDPKSSKRKLDRQESGIESIQSQTSDISQSPTTLRTKKTKRRKKDKFKNLSPTQNHDQVNMSININNIKNNDHESIPLSIQQPIQPHMQSTSKTSIQQPVKQKIKQKIKDTIHDTINDSLKDTIKGTSKESIKNSIKESNKEKTTPFFPSLGRLSPFNTTILRQPSLSHNPHFNLQDNRSDLEKKTLLYQHYANGFQAADDDSVKHMGDIAGSGAASALELRKFVEHKTLDQQKKQQTKFKKDILKAEIASLPFLKKPLSKWTKCHVKISLDGKELTPFASKPLIAHFNDFDGKKNKNDIKTKDTKTLKEQTNPNVNITISKPDIVANPNIPTSSAFMSNLLSSSYTPYQRRQKLFSYLTKQYNESQSNIIQKEQKHKQKQKLKDGEFNELLKNETLSANTSNIWKYIQKSNYFLEIHDENMGYELQKQWEPERIEQGSAYWGEMPPVTLVNDKKGKQFGLFDKLQSLLVVEDDDSQTKPNDEFNDDHSSITALQRESDFIDVSNLSLDQRTFIHLRALHLVDKPYLPRLRPIAIENDSDSSFTSKNNDNHDDYDDFSIWSNESESMTNGYYHKKDALFSHIHSLRTQLSDLNHVNNVYTANFHNKIKEQMLNNQQEKKVEEDVLIAKYSSKKQKI